MSRQEQNKLIRAKSALEDCIYNGNLAKYKMTISEVQEANTALQNIRQGDSVDTIVEGVKNFFERYGFSVNTKGIGWTISL